MQQTISSSVSKVTVYPNQARVQRTGTVEATTATKQLKFIDLPLTLHNDSVRVRGYGEARVRILGVDVRRVNYESAPAEKVQTLEQQIEALGDELAIQHDQRQQLDAELAYIAGLRTATGTYARGIARGQMSIETQAELTRALQEQEAAALTAKRAIQKEERALNRRLDKLQRDLKALQSARPRQRNEATVDVEVLSDGSFTAELTYVVNNASWQPLYDIRFGESEEQRSLEVSYIAQIIQRTGEDWLGVTISVSTARPALTQRLPDLAPWYVDLFAPPPPPVALAAAPQSDMAVRSAKASDATRSGMAFAQEVPAESIAHLAQAVAESTGLAVAFKLPGTLDVPSDGSPRKGIVNQFQLVPEIDYLSVPKHTDAVFRRITVRNSSVSPLLSGPASLFVDDEFIGRTSIEYAPVGEEIELLLGAEERITIERELVKRDVDKRRLRDNRQLRYRYEIRLQNLMDERAAVVVRDHFPVARHEDIKVRLESIEPQPVEQTDLNLIKWELMIPAGQKMVISYEFMVEHARTRRLIGLND